MVAQAGGGASAPPYERLSLLWPPGQAARPGAGLGLPATAQADLDLDELVQTLCGGEGRRERFVRSVLADLTTDAAVIAYRQDVLDDLLGDVTLRGRLRGLLPGLAALAQERAHNPRDTWSVLQIAQRLAHLELYVEVGDTLRHALDGAAIHSAGLGGLRDHLRTVAATEEYQSLQRELPGLRVQLERVGSVTIGINLSHDLLPESATIMAVSAEKIEGRGTFLERLFGGDPQRRGITPLRQSDAANIYSPENRVFRDLRQLIEIVAAPVGQAIERYAGVHARAIDALEPELSFLLNGVALAEKLAGAGLPVCRPEVAPSAERLTRLADAYNPSLALRALGSRRAGPDDGRIVTNAVSFDDDTRIWILTGPNRGGKTTYTRAAGLSHILFQAGLRVPARCARLSPVDAVFTHFPSPEGAQLGMGRLDEEADRLAGIFAAATPASLILLNEVLAGTSAIEALGLAVDAVRGLRLLGARAIYTTHLHELATRVDDLNVATPGTSQVGSLVAGVEAEGAVVASAHRRTFRIQPGPPRGVSYASEIAEQHGISFGQLEALLKRRGIIGGAGA